MIEIPGNYGNVKCRCGCKKKLPINGGGFSTIQCVRRYLGLPPINKSPQPLHKARHELK
jgi:hypothetical protein